MPNYNKVMLIGNLTKQPEMDYLPNNTPVTRFGLAVNRKFKRSDGEHGEDTLFVDCEAFGKLAEVINQYLGKGSAAFVEGRLKLDQWEDRQTGAKRSKHKVNVESVQFLDGPRNSQQQQAPQQQPRNDNPPRHQAAQRSAQVKIGDDSGFDEQDIPF
jgi:single-strand DNA-binding protein